MNKDFTNLATKAQSAESDNFGVENSGIGESLLADSGRETSVESAVEKPDEQEQDSSEARETSDYTVQEESGRVVWTAKMEQKTVEDVSQILGHLYVFGTGLPMSISSDNGSEGLDGFLNTTMGTPATASQFIPKSQGQIEIDHQNIKQKLLEDWKKAQKSVKESKPVDEDEEDSINNASIDINQVD